MFDNPLIYDFCPTEMSLVEILRFFKWIQSIAMNMSSYSAKTGDLQLSDWKMSSTTFFAGLSGLVGFCYLD